MELIQSPSTLIPKSSLRALQQKSYKQNTQLLKQITHLLYQHNTLGRPVILNWIPSHIGIYGNDQADEMAKQSLNLTYITTKIQPSLSQYKGYTKHIPQQTIIQNLNYWVDQNSPTATWYKNTTELQPPPLVYIHHLTWQ